jgi:Ca-activated chloride channel family protein
MTRLFSYFAALIIGLGLTSTFAQAPKNNVLFIVDLSGSMWEPAAGGETKIAAAKAAFGQIMNGISDTTNVGLMVFGRNIARDPELSHGVVDQKACQDIELLSPLGQRPARDLAGAIDKFQPKGETPIAGALLRSQPIFASLNGDNNSIVLITASS